MKFGMLPAGRDAGASRCAIVTVGGTLGIGAVMMGIAAATLGIGTFTLGIGTSTLGTGTISDGVGCILIV
jgi:hypothetical protein